MRHDIQPCVDLSTSDTNQKEARSHLHVLVCKMDWMASALMFLGSSLRWTAWEMKD